MLKIENVKVYDLRESVIASGNAMRLEPVEYSDEEFINGLKRMKKLINASKSGQVKCHHNALCGIRVSFDVIYPQYWTPEFQRYHFADIVTSSSKMHRLLKMDLDKSCNKYIKKSTIDFLKKEIDKYNTILESYQGYYPLTFELRKGEKITTSNRNEALYYQWMIILSNCPLGLELFMRVSTNYLQLQTIYYQRKNHKLKEDWGAFIKFIEELPYFKELILGE